MVSELKAEASAKGWPVLADVMPAQRLTFKSEMFSHSINSFSVHLIEEDAEVMKQVFRTLKSGGTALFSFWREPILARAVLAAHHATRRAGTSTLPALRRADFDVEAMRKLLEMSDFGSEDHTWNEVQESLLVDDLGKWLTAAWSLLGRTTQGWSKQDEENWAQAIEVMTRTVKEWQGYEQLAGGAVRFTMVADVVVAVKAAP
jgi:SAM-dependent methyltransferase